MSVPVACGGELTLFCQKSAVWRNRIFNRKSIGFEDEVYSSGDLRTACGPDGYSSRWQGDEIGPSTSSGWIRERPVIRL